MIMYIILFRYQQTTGNNTLSCLRRICCAREIVILYSSYISIKSPPCSFCMSDKSGQVLPFRSPFHSKRSFTFVSPSLFDALYDRVSASRVLLFYILSNLKIMDVPRNTRRHLLNREYLYIRAIFSLSSRIGIYELIRHHRLYIIFI